MRLRIAEDKLSGSCISSIAVDYHHRMEARLEPEVDSRARVPPSFCGVSRLSTYLFLPADRNQSLHLPDYTRYLSQPSGGNGLGRRAMLSAEADEMRGSLESKITATGLTRRTAIDREACTLDYLTWAELWADGPLVRWEGFSPPANPPHWVWMSSATSRSINCTGHREE